MMDLVGLAAVPRPALPARVLGRPAPAHRDRPGARPRAGPDRLRRAGLGARRVDPGAGPQPAQAAPARARPDLRVRRPQHGRRRAHQRPRGGHVPRPDRRAGRPARPVPQAGAPVHPGAHVGHPGPQPGAAPPAGHPQGRRAESRSTRRRAAASTRAASSASSSATRPSAPTSCRRSSSSAATTCAPATSASRGRAAGLRPERRGPAPRTGLNLRTGPRRSVGVSVEAGSSTPNASDALTSSVASGMSAKAGGGEDLLVLGRALLGEQRRQRRGRRPAPDLVLVDVGDPDVGLERLVRVVAGGHVVGHVARPPQRRVDRPAVLGLAESLVQPAAGVEAAAGRRVDRARHVALEDDPLALPLGDRVRHRAPPTAAPGCTGGPARRRAASGGPSSTILPRYMTATRSLMCLTTDRSWATNR